MDQTHPFAVVTGASSGIGLDLAFLCAKQGWDLLIVADQGDLHEIAGELRAHGVEVSCLHTDLSTITGVDALVAATDGREVDYLIANAGHGLGHGFLDQDWASARHVIDTNITGTTYLVHELGQRMRARGKGNILITGSIAGFEPGTFHAVYNASKAFINSFAWAVRNELKGTGVSVTVLMPGATDTAFFERADLLDTKVGQSDKADPASVAKIGFDAMLRGDGDVVAGMGNKLQTAMDSVTPSSVLAQRHRKAFEPGSGVK